VLITLAVMLWRIGVPSFWRDEAATLSATHRSLPDLFRLLANQDAVHGGYYLLMWCVVRLGGSGALAARLPSALAMAAAAGLVTVLGRRLVSARAGMAAGLVFAVLPPVSWFGQDARPFATETALACAASYLFVRPPAPALAGRLRAGAGAAGAGQRVRPAARRGPRSDLGRGTQRP
jgi:mannosyltransferase